MNVSVPVIQIDDIFIKRSPIAGTPTFVLHCELHGFQFTGYFDDMPGYLTATSEMTKFFMMKLGHISKKQAELTRDVH